MKTPALCELVLVLDEATGCDLTRVFPEAPDAVVLVFLMFVFVLRDDEVPVLVRVVPEPDATCLVFLDTVLDLRDVAVLVLGREVPEPRELVDLAALEEPLPLEDPLLAFDLVVFLTLVLWFFWTMCRY